MNRRLRYAERQKPLLVPEDTWLELLVPVKMANSTSHQFPCLKGTLEKPQRGGNMSPRNCSTAKKTYGEMESLTGRCFEWRMAGGSKYRIG